MTFPTYRSPTAPPGRAYLMLLDTVIDFEDRVRERSDRLTQLRRDDSVRDFFRQLTYTRAHHDAYEAYEATILSYWNLAGPVERRNATVRLTDITEY